MRKIQKGSTDRSVIIRIIDSTDGTPETGVVYNTSGIDLWYRREGATVTSITEATLAAADTAHSDGGIIHLGNGYYRLDLPDAAWATGASHVMIGGTVTGMIVIGQEIQLVNYNPEDSVRLGLTALPNAAADAAGGLPISDAGGLDIDAKLANTNEVTAARMGALTDLIDGGRLDLLIDSVITKIDAVDDYIDTEIASILAAVDTEVAAILADTNELQTDLANGGRVDLILDGIEAHAHAIDGHITADYGATEKAAIDLLDDADGGLADIHTVVNDLHTDVADVHTDLGTVHTDVDAILADTNELQTDWANGGRLDLLLDGASAPTAAAIRAEIDSNSTQLAAIVADTAEIQAELADGGRTDLLFDSIITKVDTVDDFLDTEVAAILAIAQKIDTMLELDGAVYKLTADALEDSPTGTGGFTATDRTHLDAILADTGTDGVLVADVETGLTFAHAMQALVALTGYLTLNGTTLTAGNAAGTKARITWVLDDGNRLTPTFSWD